MQWLDTKEVIVLSNCHTNTITEVKRKTHDGLKQVIPCPEAISFYNTYMSGVDLVNQFFRLYDPNCKSNKWWKKVFQNLLMTAAANAWIVFQELQNKKVSFIEFLVTLAEELIGYGKERSKFQRRITSGRPSQRIKVKFNIGDRLPVEGKTRRRRILRQKKLKREPKLCVACDVALSKTCFLNYHK